MYWIAIVYLLLVATKSGNARVVPCPGPSSGCDCQDAFSGNVICSGMSTLPRNLPPMVHFLDLNSNHIGSALLASQMENLSNLTLRQLYLSGTGLEAIQNRVFATQPNITTLDLSKNHFRSLDGDIFYGLVQLKALFLTKSSIYEISSIVFTFTPALEYLDLGGNKISRITNEFFTLSNLRTLLLSDNEIATIAADAFDNQTWLERLDMYGNKLQTPEKRWLDNLVANNGTLLLDYQGQQENPWGCCGRKATEYRSFLDSIREDLNSRQQYDILCASPEELGGRKLGDLNATDLEACDVMVRTNSTDLYNGTEATTVGSAEVIVVPTNMFSYLTDGNIAVIFAAVIIVTATIAGIVVHQFHSRSRSNAFDRFVDDIAKSKEGGSDDEAALTTKTYRHDAPVYGSTGNAVDRHMNGSAVSPSATKYDLYDIPGSNSDSKETDSDSSPEVLYDIPRPTPKQRRRPPPYNSPPASPDADEYRDRSHNTPTQFNNSSSVGLNHIDLEHSNMRKIDFDNFGYDSDISDDIWDVNMVG